MEYGARAVVVEAEDERLGKYLIKGEDHSLGSLLEVVLLSLKGVESAHYENPHPLSDTIRVVVRTDGSIRPREALLRALEKIEELADEFLELYRRELEKRGVDYSEWEQ